MPEETAYLVRRGIAHLETVTLEYPDDETVARRTVERVERTKKLERRTRDEQEEKSRLAREAFEKGGEKARAKRESRELRKAEKAQLKSSQASEEGLFGAHDSETAHPSSTLKSEPMPSGHPPEVGDQATKQDDIASGATASSAYFHVVPSYPVIPLPPDSIITAVPHPLFPFPSTTRDRALLSTFMDLMDRGYRIGLGPRFGGEYLVYPGDYLRYHAHFTSQVLAGDEVIRPMEIVGWGRLGTGTKKAGLLCCWPEDEKDSGEAAGNARDGSVEYYSLEWASFG